MNIRTLKKVNGVNQVKRIEPDKIYYGGYTNYKIWINYDNNTIPLQDFLKSKKVEYVLQNTCQVYYILRIKNNYKF